MCALTTAGANKRQRADQGTTNHERTKRVRTTVSPHTSRTMYPYNLIHMVQANVSSRGSPTTIVEEITTSPTAEVATLTPAQTEVEGIGTKAEARSLLAQSIAVPTQRNATTPASRGPALRTERTPYNLEQSDALNDSIMTAICPVRGMTLPLAVRTLSLLKGNICNTNDSKFQQNFNENFNSPGEALW